jgi:hypothetical protein
MTLGVPLAQLIIAIPPRAPVKNSCREGFSSKSSQKNERGAMSILAF